MALLSRAAFQSSTEAVRCADIQIWSLTKHKAVYLQPCLNSRLNGVACGQFDILCVHNLDPYVIVKELSESWSPHGDNPAVAQAALGIV